VRIKKERKLNLVLRKIVEDGFARISLTSLDSSRTYDGLVAGSLIHSTYSANVEVREGCVLLE